MIKSVVPDPFKPRPPPQEPRYGRLAKEVMLSSRPDANPLLAHIRGKWMGDDIVACASSSSIFTTLFFPWTALLISIS